MTEPDFDALARAHMARQVREAAQIQAALSRLWDQTIDPSDFRRSFDRFREAAIPLIQAGGIRGERTAEAYFENVRQSSGLGPSGVVDLGEVRPPEQIRRSLAAATKADYAAFQVSRGADPAVVIATAKAAMLGSAKRQALQTGRQKLIRLSERDPEIRGWARVSDGSPCSFCALLVSRGPVYSATSGTFRAHDGCGCSVRVVTRRDRSGGWSADARAYRDLYDREGGNIQDFRTALRTAREAGEISEPSRVPSSPLATGGSIDRIQAAERMYGTGSAQHREAIRRWG